MKFFALLVASLAPALSAYADGGWVTRNGWATGSDHDDPEYIKASMISHITYANGIAQTLEVINQGTSSVYISGIGIGANQQDNSTGTTGTEVPAGTTKSFPLGYQSTNDPIQKVYFTYQYWDPNKKTPPDTTVSYTGDLKSIQQLGQSTIQTEDQYAKLLFLPQPDQSMRANVTYGDGKSKWIETCSVTINPDGTMTLKGISYQTLYGSTQFSLDVFTLWQNADGTISGQSSDGAGGGNSLLFHKGS